MFVKARKPYGGLTTTQIDIGKFIDDDDSFIVLKEPSVRQSMFLRAPQEGLDGESAMVAAFLEILPDLIVDHNLYEDEDKLMDKQGVADIICDKTPLALFVLKEYSEKLFPAPPKKAGDK